MMAEIIVSILLAIRAVESSGGMDPRAEGNDLQITRVCIEDVNRILAKRNSTVRYSTADAKDLRKSHEIAVIYLTYWVEFIRRNDRSARAKDVREVASRIWHRGPRNWKDSMGAIYWAKVRRHLDD